MKRILIIIITAFILLLPVWAWATNYYVNADADAGGNYYLLHDPDFNYGNRVANNVQAYGTTASDYVLMNDAVIQDGDGNDLDLTYNVVDVDGTGTIAIAVPYPTGTPKEFSSSSTLATAVGAGFYGVGDDNLACTTANAIGTVDLSAYDGTSGHPITIDGGGFSDSNPKTYGDWWIIKRRLIR